MKHLSTKHTFIFSLFLSLALCSSKCGEGYYNVNYTAYTPVFMKRAELENSISINVPRELKAASKIYTKDNYLYVSEAGNGLHVINNTNPSNPIKVAFIKIIGCNDMAIKGNILFVDNATDLVSIDLTNPSELKVNSRIRDAFPEPTPPDGLTVKPEHDKAKRPSDLILVTWKK